MPPSSIRKRIKTTFDSWLPIANRNPVFRFVQGIKQAQNTRLHKEQLTKSNPATDETHIWDVETMILPVETI